MISFHRKSSTGRWSAVASAYPGTARCLVLETAKARAGIDDFRRRGELQPQLLISLLREGEQSRPCFVDAFAVLA